MPADALLSPTTTDLTCIPSVPASASQVAGELVLVLGPGEGEAAGVDPAAWRSAQQRLGEVSDVPVVVEQTSDAKGGRRVTAVPAASTRDEARALGGAVGRFGLTLDGRAEVVVAHPLLADAGLIEAFVEGVVLGGFRPVHVSMPAGTESGQRSAATVAEPGALPARRTMLVTGEGEGVVERAVTVARASLVARNLANTPANIATPQWMAERARAVADRRGLRVAVRDEVALADEGFGGLLAVGGGSANPPRLVELGYEPADGAAAHVVLVGKGITFDTGGISVKPAEAMAMMKTDMSGSAVVLAVIDAIAAMGLPVKVTALLPLAENAFGESSYRPGDVVTPFGGRRTVEISNTDAEGRVVMADALAYADDHLDPDVVIDVATLTGAARVALARSMAALFATDDELAGGLRAAGASSGEPLWRFPLHQPYRTFLESSVADLDNAPGKAGTITAALFLAEFVGDRRWAHLDIAGPGRSDDDTGLLSEGATGYGARALITWLEGMDR
ncbi:hypothetical protein GCM10022199_13070 [Marihabitans asiaticum]|uniref:Probable cytosol aminopeptidase n=1 Tax=Marihabitans asiaticum TaxID=415218 RepID=A0A560WI49_9MICO|nr:M17 family metallopeptidase [Marihabitans asiaticum]TWD17319.1 leucyl aminopeptidase [Marihabitans asiaticum]